MPRSRSHYSPLRLTPAVLACWIAIGGSLACACTIPVFRYALERWESDRFLVMVYHRGELTAEQDAAITELSKRSAERGGPLNIEVLRHDLASPAPFQLLDLQPPPADGPLPWMEIRSRVAERRTALRWQGPLADAIDQPGLFDSPARTEIVRRLVGGDSCVWLLVAPEDQVQRRGQQMQKLLDAAPAGLELPKGIGLPGSELYAPIPLHIRFSVLPVSHTDPAEQTFFKLLATSAKEWRSDTAYVIPVFGRGRALEVFSYADDDEALVQDVGSFLCAACSCRVKQANPGFDLVLSVDWNKRLFGDAAPPSSIQANVPPSGAILSIGSPNAPEFLAIPIGNQPAFTPEPAANSRKVETQIEAERDEAARDVESEPTHSGALSDVAASQSSASTNEMVLLLVVLALVSGAILAGVIFSRSRVAAKSP